MPRKPTALNTAANRWARSGSCPASVFIPAKTWVLAAKAARWSPTGRNWRPGPDRLREHGSTQRYHYDEVGYNYRMEGLQGAVLGVKLKYLPMWLGGRRRVALRYQEMLADTPLRLPCEAEYALSAWHLYVVRHPQRDALKRHLETHQVGCGLHYPVPLHRQKCYASLGHCTGDFPVAEQAARECLSLPIFPELTDEQIQRVASVIKAFFAS